MSCKIIPVVDLRNGVAVRAVAGDRANYKQLDIAVFKSNDLCRIIEVLLKLSRSNILYVANLNGIAGDDSYDCLLYEIMREFSEVEIWVDNGFKDLEELSSFHKGF
ncbi:MAG: HisA/HisF-related TIM barrel protein, partial [Burkholderiaceae bacterium]